MNALFFWLASAVWSALTGFVRIGVAAGILQPDRLDCRVISVGNLQAGGAGKTPLVALIAREAAQKKGLNVCILCRGYGAEWEGTGGIIPPIGERPDVADCGDEAALLHDLAPQAYIGVGADRVRQFELVKQLARAQGREIQLVILDDGFQHWRIHKDLEIVAVTSAQRTSSLFRDWPAALLYADLAVWTKGTQRPEFYGRPHCRVLYRLPDPSDKNAIWLITGVADGEFARQTAVHAGYQVSRHISFPDHARYDEGMVHEIIEQALRAECSVAVTGKDWVKWREFGIPHSKVIVLEPALVFEEGQETWDRMLWA